MTSPPPFLLSHTGRAHSKQPNPLRFHFLGVSSNCAVNHQLLTSLCNEQEAEYPACSAPLTTAFRGVTPLVPPPASADPPAALSSLARGGWCQGAIGLLGGPRQSPHPKLLPSLPLRDQPLERRGDSWSGTAASWEDALAGWGVLGSRGCTMPGEPPLGCRSQGAPMGVGGGFWVHQLWFIGSGSLSVGCSLRGGFGVSPDLSVPPRTRTGS